VAAAAAAAGKLWKVLDVKQHQPQLLLMVRSGLEAKQDQGPELM
jgi:hypothetical protein